MGIYVTWAIIILIAAVIEMVICLFSRKALLRWIFPAAAFCAGVAFFVISKLGSLEGMQSLAFTVLAIMALVACLSACITAGACALLMRVAKNKK